MCTNPCRTMLVEISALFTSWFIELKRFFTPGNITGTITIFRLQNCKKILLYNYLIFKRLQSKKWIHNLLSNQLWIKHTNLFLIKFYFEIKVFKYSYLNSGDHWKRVKQTCRPKRKPTNMMQTVKRLTNCYKQWQSASFRVTGLFILFAGTVCPQ